MPILNKLTGAFSTALSYITAGTLIAIWTVVYWAFNAPESRAGFFWVVGFLLTGVSLLGIGLLLAKFGGAAQSATLLPFEVTPTTARSQQTAATTRPSSVSVGPSNPQTADVITSVASSDGPATLLKTD